MTLNIYTNRPKTKDFTLNFFYHHAAGCTSAQLACPFFTDPRPVQVLRGNGCGKVQLLVRLCEATSPEALATVCTLNGVDIRFYTSPIFHAKFYILGEQALIGSANLTSNGMMANRELSIVLDASDPRFDELPSYFDELWAAPPAAVLTPEALSRFRDWCRLVPKMSVPPLTGVQPAEPVYINVKSQTFTTARTYLESFRSLYHETLIPHYRIVRELYRERHQRHSGFEALSETYEIDRFVFWVRSFTTDEDLQKHPIRFGMDLQENIRKHIADWFATGHVNIDSERLRRIAGLQQLFSEQDNLSTVTLNDITDMLQGCMAFLELQRFAKGGLDSHLAAFQRDNSIEDIRNTFHYLAFGSGDFVQRLYDCIYMSKYKLAHWGRNCTLELFGWTNHDDAPPFNGRIIKALRYLGFGVPV
jgi:hypothetical protein